MKGNRYHRFRIKHPNWHGFFMILAVFLPLGLIGLIFGFFSANDNVAALGVYTIAGGLVLGAGLTFWVGTDFDKAVFMRGAIYPISIGALVMLVSIFCIYNNRISQQLDGDYLVFQLTCFLCVFWFSVSYSIARKAITDHVSKKSKLTVNQIDDRQEGFFNRLWYQEIHQEYGIGWIYYYNVIYTTALFLLLIGTIALFFHRFIANIVMPLCWIVAAGLIGLEIFALVCGKKYKKNYFGTQRRGLLGKVPYFYEFASFATILLFAWMPLKYFIRL